MSVFNGNDISERRKSADKAKQALLDRFRARQDDPATAERKAARLATAQAREARVKAREDARRAEAELLAADQKAREAEAARLAIEKAELDAVERRAEGDRAVELVAQQKAARDGRYAARKARRS